MNKLWLLLVLLLLPLSLGAERRKVENWLDNTTYDDEKISEGDILRDYITPKRKPIVEIEEEEKESWEKWGRQIKEDDKKWQEEHKDEFSICPFLPITPQPANYAKEAAYLAEENNKLLKEIKELLKEKETKEKETYDADHYLIGEPAEIPSIEEYGITEGISQGVIDPSKTKEVPRVLLTDYTELVKQLAEEGEICKVFGHWWVESGFSALIGNEIQPGKRRCRICGKEQTGKYHDSYMKWEDE